MKTSPDKQPPLDPTYWLEHHGDYLYRYALTRVFDAAVAEDLLQETLLAAMGGYQEHEGRSSERTWLIGILRHKIVDHFRRLARTPEFRVGDAVVSAEVDFFEREGPCSEEICEILGISPNNLWVLLHRSRVKLRHFLEAEWFRGNRPAAPATDKTQRLLKVGEFPPEFTMRVVAA